MHSNKNCGITSHSFSIKCAHLHYIRYGFGWLGQQNVLNHSLYCNGFDFHVILPLIFLLCVTNIKHTVASGATALCLMCMFSFLDIFFHLLFCFFFALFFENDHSGEMADDLSYPSFECCSLFFFLLLLFFSRKEDKIQQ